MRVAIEAASLALTSGGLARYTCELSLALARAYPDDEFYLTSDQAFAMPPDAPPKLRQGGGPRNSLERRWWLWGLSRELGRLSADLIHGPDFSVPYIRASQCSHAARSFALVERGLACGRPPCKAAYSDRSKWALDDGHRA